MAQRQTGKWYIKKIDFVFYHEKDVRDAIKEFHEYRESQRENKGSSTAIVDPTAAQAIRNMTPLRGARIDGHMLEWPESWLHVIDATYGWCNNDQLIVSRDRYSGVDYRITCAKLSIAQPQYYKLLNSVRYRATLCAVQYGLVKVC